MTEVIQIDGAPGAGKTHTLKEKLREEKHDGLGVDSFWWLTFTNAGRSDVKPELADLFPNADGDATDRAQTFHSLVLSLTIRNGLIPADAVDDVLISPLDPDVQGYYADFCDRHGLGFNPDYANPRKLLGGEKATEHTGNLLFAVNDYLTQTCKPPEKWQSASVDLPIPGDRVVALLDAWSDYKRTAADMRLFEHGDYVAEAVDRSLYPDVDVLLVDEFQDLALLNINSTNRGETADGLSRSISPVTRISPFTHSVGGRRTTSSTRTPKTGSCSKHPTDARKQ